MLAIETKYLPCTNTRDSRIKAYTEHHSVTINYPHECGPGMDAAAQAAIALCKKMGWKGPLIGAGTKNGYVFVFANSREFERYEV